MRFQNSPKSAYPGHFKRQNSKIFACMFFIAKTTPEDLNLPKFAEREVLSVGHATARNIFFAIKLLITVTDDE